MFLRGKHRPPGHHPHRVRNAWRQPPSPADWSVRWCRRSPPALAHWRHVDTLRLLAGDGVVAARHHALNADGLRRHEAAALPTAHQFPLLPKSSRLGHGGSLNRQGLCHETTAASVLSQRVAIGDSAEEAALFFTESLATHLALTQ